MSWIIPTLPPFIQQQALISLIGTVSCEILHRVEGEIEQNHIFYCNADDVTTNAKGNKVIPYKIKEADIIDAVVCDIKTVRKKKRGQELPNTTHPQPLAPITENPYKVVEFYDMWRKVIPEQFRAVAFPKPIPEQYAAVKLEAGIRSGVKKFKRDQKAGKLLHMEMEALESFVKQSRSEKGGLKTTGLDDKQSKHTEVWM